MICSSCGSEVPTGYVYCLQCGSHVNDPPPTVRWNAPPVETSPTNRVTAEQSKPKTKASIWWLLLYVVCGALSIFGGLVLYNMYQGKNSNQETKQDARGSEPNSSNKTMNNSSDRQSLDNSSIPRTVPSATPTIAPQNSPSPNNAPTLTNKLDVTGTWTGTFANRDAILFINSQEGDSFSGILKNTKGAIVAISGHVNRDTRQISIQENRVVEGYDWVLGTDRGSLSMDGRRISGSGRDRVGHNYTFSFTKD
jgi:hypothetical protein